MVAVRLLAISMLLILAKASAAACPAGTACVAAETRSSKERESRLAVADVAALATAAEPELARPDLPAARVHSRTLLAHAFARIDDGRGPLDRSLRTHVVPRQRTVQMPWVWQVLRKSVYARMPSYESGRQENKFSLVLAPVVVDSPADSVPGVGIEGAF